MNITLIAAVAENRAIGKDNDLIWHLPNDMAFFKRTTEHHHILTGRKNYESIPEKYRPLKNRTNIVVTRNEAYEATGAVVFQSIDKGITHAMNQGEEELFIIGGAEIYNQTIGLANRLYITWVEGDFEADAYFPQFKEEDWELVQEIRHEADEKHKYAMRFCTYERIAKV